MHEYTPKPSPRDCLLMHSLYLILSTVAILLLFSCGNKGDLYLDSTKALEQQLEAVGEKLDRIEQETPEDAADPSVPRKRRPATETDANRDEDSSS